MAHRDKNDKKPRPPTEHDVLTTPARRGRLDMSLVYRELKTSLTRYAYRYYNLIPIALVADPFDRVCWGDPIDLCLQYRPLTQRIYPTWYVSIKLEENYGRFTPSPFFIRFLQGYPALTKDSLTICFKRQLILQLNWMVNANVFTETYNLIL